LTLSQQQSSTTQPLASPVTQTQPTSLSPVQSISPTASSRPTNQVPSSKLIVTPVSMGTISPPKSLRQDSTEPYKLSNFSSELSHSTFPQNPFPPPPEVQLKSSMTPSQSKSPQPSFPSPNYNIYSSPLNPLPTTSPFLVSNISPSQQQFSAIPSIPTPPAMGGLLVPSRPANFSSTGTSSHALSKDDWGDFDPLS
jgi:SCY1-like protein 2